MQIKVESTFERGLKSLPPDRARAAIKSLQLFIEAPNLPRLRFRELKGIKGFYIISSKGGDRIILRKDESDVYAAVDVGPHDNVYRRWSRVSG